MRRSAEYVTFARQYFFTWPLIACKLNLIGDIFLQDEGQSVELVVKRDTDPKAMKINELRDELDARGLSSKGIF